MWVTFPSNVDYAESDKLARKWRKEQLAAGASILDTYGAAVYADAGL